MVQNAGIRSVNAEKGYFHTQRLIVDNSNKLVYLTSRLTALRSTKPNYIFHRSLTHKTHAPAQVHPEFPETSQRNEITLLQGF